MTRMWHLGLLALYLSHWQEMLLTAGSGHWQGINISHQWPQFWNEQEEYRLWASSLQALPLSISKTSRNGSNFVLHKKKLKQQEGKKNSGFLASLRPLQIQGKTYPACMLSTACLPYIYQNVKIWNTDSANAGPAPGTLHWRKTALA
jgi:hypothetical protein